MKIKLNCPCPEAKESYRIGIFLQFVKGSFENSLLVGNGISKVFLDHWNNFFSQYLGQNNFGNKIQFHFRSAALAQFVIHRGLIITTMQAIFSAVFYFSSVSLYPGFMMVGFSTVYTMFPVFSLVLDKDVSGRIALMYPELYKDLSKGRSLTFKTFFTWCLISIYQGGVIMFGALLLFEDEFVHVVSISFTALILTELVSQTFN